MRGSIIVASLGSEHQKTPAIVMSVVTPERADEENSGSDTDCEESLDGEYCVS